MKITIKSPLPQPKTQAQTSGSTSSSNGSQYVVKRGDTLSGISQDKGIGLDTLLGNNPQIKNPNKLYPGQLLQLKPPVHTVKKGDTLSKIADTFEVGLKDLVRANSKTISNEDRIFPGQQLNIPNRPSTTRPAQQPQTTRPAQQPQQPQTTRPAQQPQTTRPAQQPQQPQTTRPAASNTTQSSRVNNGLKNIDLKDFLSVDKGSQSLAAILIGNAEGTRTPDGGKTPAYGEHRDPGNGAKNKGSFSYQNSNVGSPAEADRIQLQAMNTRLGTYTQAVRKAGLDPNNALLAAAYFDSYNQSPSAAGRFLQQMPYLKEHGVTAKNVIEARFQSYVNPDTGKRYLNSEGKPVGSGLANVARARYKIPNGEPVPEKLVQQVIRDDQANRINKMVLAMTQQGLTTTPGKTATPGTTPAPAKSTTPATPPPSRPVSTGAPFTSLAAAKASGVYIDQMAGDPNKSNANCGFASALMALKALGLKEPAPDNTLKEGSVAYRQAMTLRRNGGAGTSDGGISTPKEVEAALKSIVGDKAGIEPFTWGSNKLKATEVMRKAFLNPNSREVFVAAGVPSLGWPEKSSFGEGHWVAVTGYDPKKDTFIVMDPFVPSKAPIEVTAKQLAGYLSAGNAEKSELIRVTAR